MAELFTDNKIKTIAFYLPQYHSIPENDEAWGEGFTEWTNVKKAKPLFEGHQQPKIPLNNNYYNLLDNGVLEWQSNLAKTYNIFGFCFYHYWFKNGKKLLEKPAEKLLENGNINLPFCFCWANENWCKRWDGGNREIIIEQDYGNIEDWEEHFQYLLSFFNDYRYITFNEKPVFVIYRPEIIPNLDKMLSYFRKRTQESGFSGLEIMFQYPTYLDSNIYNEKLYDHYICFEPAHTLHSKRIQKERNSFNLKRHLKKIIGEVAYRRLGKLYGKIIPTKLDALRVEDYDGIWKDILSNSNSEKFIYGAFVDWDNTARKKTGMVVVGATPNKFKSYFIELVKKVKSSKSPNIIFINAWNEWGEGAYLEPDTLNEYDYLCAIKCALNDERF